MIVLRSKDDSLFRNRIRLRSFEGACLSLQGRRIIGLSRI